MAWHRLRSGELGLAWAVVNVYNGPGVGPDVYYSEALRPGSAATFVGYVTVGYGSRSPQDILADVTRWRELYGITDVMLDEVPIQRHRDQWDIGVIDTLRAAGVDRVFANPGTFPPIELLFACDAVCVAEQTWETYRELTWPAWLAEDFVGRTWHLVHSVPVADLGLAESLAEQRGAGFLWATDATPPNPWGRLPAGTR